jgi:hypothetical protein
MLWNLKTVITKVSLGSNLKQYSLFHIVTTSLLKLNFYTILKHS